ncbi:MAG: ABC transporter ATP-binding protein [Desulfuromonadaceae bacterium]|nr:ABC transporter ATP-binding protein [Desulfuromonadaceae bacterium]MDD2849955.1 ABC transporter ATP-binding protein [Desulfuromonadaceae bacterium]MDD4130900.1 ABC transporter ATP-binding protein [Desulfuromonadaceae bacterium]
MIELKSVTKRYDSVTAVDNVSFSVKAGECFALLGPNGAGKTTIVKMLLDFIPPTSGSLSLGGIPSTLAECRQSVGYLAENHRIPADLSGWQYLLRCAELLDIDRSEATDQCRRIVEMIGMQGREQAKSGTYSKGMVQRFGLGAALMGGPKLLILDEPTGGLDPIGIRELRQLLESLKGQGMTIFLNSHLLSEVEKICDTAAIINRGKLLVKDAISDIVKDGDTLEDVFVRLVKG